MIWYFVHIDATFETKRKVLNLHVKMKCDDRKFSNLSSTIECSQWLSFVLMYRNIPYGNGIMVELLEQVYQFLSHFFIHQCPFVIRSLVMSIYCLFWHCKLYLIICVYYEECYWFSDVRFRGYWGVGTKVCWWMSNISTEVW